MASTLPTIGSPVWSVGVPESQTNLAWDVLLDLGSSADGPLHERLTRALRAAIRSGRVAAGSALPPSRTLAADLGCSRWAVTEAYGQLVAEGYLEARTGSATRVRWPGDAAPARASAGTERAVVPRYDLAPGLPDLRAFPRRRWADAVRAVTMSVPYAELGFPREHGELTLRRTLAEHLRRSRGVQAGPRDVTVCTSVTDGVVRLCRMLRADGITAIGCEEPGWTRLREAIRSAGMETVPVAADAGGLRVDELARHTGLRAVLATPAHQFPRGEVLTPDRRAALLHWARDVDGIVLEDDYDAEFRYDRRPVGTVQGMDPSRVVLLKSLSKMLSPGLGIGWVVTPPRWTDRLRAAPGPLPPVLDQLAFARLLDSGGYERHLRAVRLRYRNRRDALVRALARHMPGAPVSGVAAGLHLVLGLPDQVDATRVVAAAAARSMRVAALAAYHDVAADAGNALVLGYGNLADTAVDDAVRLLVTATRES